ncbi:LuxR C-terminal-related transcriptional regulator [Marinobacter sp.]|uniref:LuxR C-terminal-related transcriptional regulator n=1 Tax=Marinobacter sp. TaxID=50741 RepID=UPI003568A370
MGEIEARDVLATQKKLYHKLLGKRAAITSCDARDLAAQSLLLLDDAQQCWQLVTDWLQARFDADRVDGGWGRPFDPVYTPAQAESFASRAPISSMRALRVENTDPGVRDLWLSDQPVVYVDIAQEPRFRSGLRHALIAAGTTTKLAVALKSGRRPFGLLCMDRVVSARPWEGRAYESFTNVVEEVLAPVLSAAEQLCDGTSHLVPQPQTGLTGTLQESPLSRLTTAERTVARLAASGKSYKEIARELDRAFSTIDHQLRSIRRKLAVRSHSQLVSLLASRENVRYLTHHSDSREYSR